MESSYQHYNHTLGLSVSSKETLSFLPAGFPLEKCDRTREVLSMSWEHKSKERVRTSHRCMLLSLLVLHGPKEWQGFII